jgi:hypothetical protein
LRGGQRLVYGLRRRRPFAGRTSKEARKEENRRWGGRKKEDSDVGDGLDVIWG